LNFPEPEDIDFDRKVAEELGHSSYTINPLRWERVRNDVRFEDVVEELTGKTGQTISCPFHGPETVPSFRFYRSSNSGWCFGCPAGTQFYDAIAFTSRLLEINRLRALKWLEKEFNLPPLDDVQSDEQDSEEETLNCSFEDLVPAFISAARKQIQATQDVTIAQEYLKIYFQAEDLTGKSANEEEKQQAAIMLAEVLGKDTLNSIKLRLYA
jgi:DNA primase